MREPSEAERPPDAGTESAPDSSAPSKPRTSGPRRLMERFRTMRPILLAALAAVAFVGLLRWHHQRFERRLVSDFQRWQLNSAESVAGAMEEVLDRILKNLATIQPDALRLSLPPDATADTPGATARRPAVEPTPNGLVAGAPGGEGLLDSYYRAHRDIVRRIWILGADGSVLAQSPGGSETLPAWAQRLTASGPGGKPTLFPGVQARIGHGAATPVPQPGAELLIYVPLREGEALRGAAVARVDVARLYARCAARPTAGRGGSWRLIDPVGDVVHASNGATPDGGAASGANVLTDIAEGRSGVSQVQPDDGPEQLLAYAPVRLVDQRYGLVIARSKSGVSVPILSHERVTYTLIAALAVLYFGTAYISYRSERAHLRLEQERRESAEAASRSKSDFLAKMSHEIRTPMNGVVGMTDLALETDLTEDQRRYLTMVRKSAESLLTVINDILDLSRIEAGRLELSLQPFRLRRCIQDALEPLEVQTDAKGIRLRWHVDEEVPDELIGDPGRLRQVLINLVGNAIKFTQEGGIHVTVLRQRSAADEAMLRFAVRDTGVGIRPDRQSAIFQAFEQRGAFKTSRQAGAGLGLAIASHLVQRMGGRIWVESEPGAGSTFHFTVRLRHDEPHARDAAGPAAETDGLLIVQGPESHASLMAQVARGLDLRQRTVDNGHDALMALKESADRDRPYAVVVFDAELPGIDGWTLAQRAREDSRLDATALIIISAAGLRGDTARCREVGIDGYLTAPLSLPLVYEALAAALETAGRSDELITRHSLADRLPVAGLTAPQAEDPGARRDSPPPAGGTSQPSGRPAWRTGGSEGPPSPDGTRGRQHAARTPGRAVPRPLRILLAEDNPVNREHLSVTLRKWDCIVLTAEDGRQAVATAAAERPDLILMDAQMPVMSGLEAAAAIRQAEKNTARHVPIVAITAHAMKEDRQRCLDAGMDSYVSKPIRPDELYKAVRELLRRDPTGPDEQPSDAAEASGPEQAAPQKTAPAGGAKPLLDEPKALAFAGDDEAAMGRILRAFADSLPEMVGAIRQTAEDGDADALAKAAHRLKGSLGLVADDDLVADAETLEEHARAGETDAARRDVHKLLPLLADLSAQLDVRLRSKSNANVGSR